MDKEKKLYEAFCTYIETCKKLTPVLWDSIASPELLEADKKYGHFIKNFESTKEFKNLIKTLEDWDVNKEHDVVQYYYYYLGLRNCLLQFFINTEIYDRIISGKEFNKDKAFAIFWEELEKKDMEVLKYGEAFPLKIEMKRDQILEFGDFSLLIDLHRYHLNADTNFVFLLKRSLGSPPIRWIPSGHIEETEIRGETPFSLLLFIFNLYFEKPICIPEWYETHSSLLSSTYQPKRNFSEQAWSITGKFNSALWDKYYEEALDSSWVDEGGTSYIDQDKVGEFINSKVEEFINSGKAPINYLKEAEIENFKKFVTKIREFLRSDLYKEQKYLQIATHYYLMAHERPDIADNLVNYVIALEALYFAQETSEMRERLANRIANLLGKTSEEKTKIRETALRVYKLRCNYVHGKISDLNKYGREEFGNREEFNNWLRNILRISLLSFFSLSKYYDSNKKREELLENLDSVFDSNLIENTKIQASDFLRLARPYDFIHKADDNDVIELL